MTQMVKLGDVCQFFSGTQFHKEIHGKDTGELPFYKISDISKTLEKGSRFIEAAENYLNFADLGGLPARIIPENTIIFAKNGFSLTYNRRVITTRRCLVDLNIVGIKASSDRLLDTYLFFYLSSLDMSVLSQGTAVPSVSLATLKSLEIHLPPIDDQKRIVSVLQTMQDEIIKRQRQIQLIDDAEYSLLFDMFGNPSDTCRWPAHTVGSFSLIKIGPSGLAFRKQDYVENGFPVINPVNISDNIIIPDITVSVKPEIYQKMKSYQLKPGDLVLVRSGGIGKSAIVTNSGYLCGTGCLFIRADSSYRSLFLKKIFDHPLYIQRLAEHSVGSAIKFLTSDILKNLLVPFPPIELQDEYLGKVIKLEKLRARLTIGLSKMQESYNALIQMYFV